MEPSTSDEPVGTPEPVPLRRAMLGLSLALDRLKVADGAGHWDEGYCAGGEGIMWVCSADEYAEQDTAYVDLRATHPSGAVVTGLRLARNAMLHELVDTTHKAGSTFPATFPLVFAHLVWKERSAMPPPRRRQRPGVEQAWDTHLAGRPVGKTLGQAASFFAAYRGRFS